MPVALLNPYVLIGGVLYASARAIITAISGFVAVYMITRN